MAIHGVDISRYQGKHAMDGYEFVIVNAEDPGFGEKINYAKQIGIPWGSYTWIYPGNGVADMDRSVRVCAPHGDPPMGHWLDYEQKGITESDCDDALNRANELGIHHRTGVYTYLHVLNSSDIEYHLQGCPLWIAYYPGNNDGGYPPGQIGDANRYGAVMWQYTSGANDVVGLDRNVVINVDWYHQWTGGAWGFWMALTDAEQKELLEHVRNLAKEGIDVFGIPNVFDSLNSMTRSGVKDYGLPNLFEGQHQIKERLDKIEEKLGIT